MKPAEYVKLMEKIQKEHLNIHITTNKMRKIKYVTCNYDTRDGEIYSISFRQWFTKDQVTFPRDVEFGVQPKVRVEMYDDIIEWLEEVR